MSQPKLSIVIPVYHSEKYLSECLDSILCQDFPEYEVICVDDGSTDGSLEVLKGYALRDPRFRVILANSELYQSSCPPLEGRGTACGGGVAKAVAREYMSQSHGGPGAARNLGMAEAKGEYLYFMDSDDFLSGKDVFSLMVEEMDSSALDLLWVNAEVRFESEELQRTRCRETQRYRAGEVYGSFERGRDLYCAMIRGGGFPCNAFFQCARTGFLRDIHAAFPAMDFYEDEVYAFRVLLQAGRVRHTGLRPYVRRVRAESITTREPGFRSVRDGLCAWRDMMGFLWEQDVEEAVRETAMLHMARLGRDIARKYHELPEAEREKHRALPEEERSILAVVMNLQSVFRRQTASYLFPYHLFRRGARVVIYGAGNVGREFFLQAGDTGYVECVGLLDRQAGERREDGLPVHLPEEIRGMDYDAVLIAIQDEKLAESARENLLALGVPEERIAWDGGHYLKRDFYEGCYFPFLETAQEQGILHLMEGCHGHAQG